jgi:hypothetical protein
MYKFFYFKIEIKTKIDSYMPCAANGPPYQVCGRTRVIGGGRIQQHFKLA